MEVAGTGMDIVAKNEFNTVGSNLSFVANEHDPSTEENLKSNSTMGVC